MKNSSFKKTLYIEGTTDLDNGNLRKAFSLLLEKDLKGTMPQIIMGDGISQTIDKFMTKPLLPNEKRYLLIDADRFLTDGDREGIISQYNTLIKKPKQTLGLDNTFFMIQEAEAWILSQPDILEDFKISTAKLPKKNVMEIEKPSEVLSRLYKSSQKEYHKVSEFVKVFPKLDTDKLKGYFSDYNRLIFTLIQ